MVKPLITVIVPCYNQGRLLPEAVRSVQRQTYPHWECLIVNDGSTDDTEEMARALMAADPRIRLISQTNRGLAGARNAGLAEAKGQWIQFLDADDIIMPGKLAAQLAPGFNRDKLSVLSCDYRFGRADNIHSEVNAFGRLRVKLDPEKPLEDLVSNWETRLSIPCHCFLFDARIFQNHPVRFCEQLENHEDWDCWLQVFSLPVEYRHIGETLVIYRTTGSSMRANRLRMRRGYLRAIKRQSVLQERGQIRKLLSEKRKEVKRAYYDCTRTCMLRNRFGASFMGPFWRRMKFCLRRLYLRRNGEAAMGNLKK